MNRYLCLFCAFFLACGVTAIVPARGATLQSEDQKLALTDAFAAFAMAMDGDTALVGTSIIRGDERDAVYVFRQVDGTWVRTQQLEPWDPNVTRCFRTFASGLRYRSLAIDGDVALVPGYREGDWTRGAVYAFAWNGATWEADRKLTLADGGERFDGPVAVRGHLAVLGGWQTTGDTSIRAAFVFRKVDGIWIKEQTLVPSQPASGDFFAHEVAVSDDGEMVVVGAGYYGALSAVDPVVHIFRRQNSAWIETQQLTAANGSPTGHSVALSGDWLFAGNPLGAADFPTPGFVTVFHWNGSTWETRQTLRASDSFAYNNFGNVVDVRGDVAVIGANINPELGSPSAGYEGQAYLFRLNGNRWREENKLVTVDAETSSASVQSFGYTAAVSEETALVSSINSASDADVCSYAISADTPGGCGCSSETGDEQTIALITDTPAPPLHKPMLLVGLLAPFGLFWGIDLISRRKKKKG